MPIAVKKKRKPHRPCPFCFIPQSRLSRHMRLKHSSEDSIKYACSLPEPEQKRQFDKLKKWGIFQRNKKLIQEGKPLSACIKERDQSKDNELEMCTFCHGFFAKKYFHRHVGSCKSQVDCAEGGVQSIPVELLGNEKVDKGFRDIVLAKLRKDKIGSFCREDHLALTYGNYLFKNIKNKKDKKTEARRTVMCEMRRLGHLFFAFQNSAEAKGLKVKSEDMLNRSFFYHLEDAINSITLKQDDEIKAGLKLALGYMLVKIAKTMKGHYFINNMDEKADDVDKFMSVLKLKWTTLFGDAEYKVDKDRNTRLRKPAALPVEDDIKTIRNYTVNRIQQLLSQFTFFGSAEFVELRDLVVSRLTLFNARRGGEPSRMLVSEWQEAEQGAWINPDHVQQVNDEAEKVLLGQYLIAYQSGKGKKHLVPVLIPNDCKGALKVISDVKTRGDCGVNPENFYLFPNTQNSLDHRSGWHATKEVCLKSDVPTTLTATQMRHRASTFYALMDVDEHERTAFYQHMGHSADMNREVYQCPLAVKEVTKIWRFFNTLDYDSGSFEISN